MKPQFDWGALGEEQTILHCLEGLGYLGDDVVIHQVIKPWAAAHGMLGELGFEEEPGPELEGE